MLELSEPRRPTHPEHAGSVRGLGLEEPYDVLARERRPVRESRPGTVFQERKPLVCRRDDRVRTVGLGADAETKDDLARKARRDPVCLPRAVLEPEDAPAFGAEPR